ncbi:hypothetical protein Pmani_018494 [Petrolisthes manimaculis]|uniref:Uncharacterized protein n=1 Tax=Petrolisthes manimaculis TaxID=1843537 RepID=A0AAE1U4T7_9EUCA|nr:hypothetical protein Pmani_018494 [Petrolisthes manimaculis]
MKPIQKHVGSQVSGVGQNSGSVKISTTASILPKVVSVYVKRGRNCEAAVTLSVKTLMNVHHLVFTPRSVPMAKASTGVLVLSDTHLILIRKPARLQIILWPT